MRPTPPGFDWGEGCAPGRGSFERDLPVVGGKEIVGIIPANKWNVLVELEGVGDIDIQLFDMTDTSEFDEGRAIVGWCNSSITGCALGLLSNSTFQSITYTRGDLSIEVEYSGYNGVNGKAGSEFIRIVGETTMPLMMKAYAFAAGSAKVEYSWSRQQSPCCLGFERCSGSFQQAVRLKEYVVVGEIPPGKRDIVVELMATGDVDVQIYDLDDTSEFEEGQAVIAWSPCEASSQPCNAGFLSGPVEANATYPPEEVSGLSYFYSGYNGYNGKLGFEKIMIFGTSNRRLRMTVFGFDKAIDANVTYSFYEPDSNEKRGRARSPRSSSRSQSSRSRADRLRVRTSARPARSTLWPRGG